MQHCANFNKQLSRIRVMVERVFGSMKERFRILHTQLPYKIVNINNTIKSVAVLHNFLGKQGEELLVEEAVLEEREEDDEPY